MEKTNATHEDEPWVTLSPVSRELERSLQQVRNYADSNRLPCLKTASGLRLFRPADVRAFKKVLEQERRARRRRRVAMK